MAEDAVEIIQKITYEADTSAIDFMNDKLKGLNETLEKTVELLKQVKNLQSQ